MGRVDSRDHEKTVSHFLSCHSGNGAHLTSMGCITNVLCEKAGVTAWPLSLTHTHAQHRLSSAADTKTDEESSRAEVKRARREWIPPSDRDHRDAAEL